MKINAICIRNSREGKILIEIEQQALLVTIPDVDLRSLNLL